MSQDLAALIAALALVAVHLSSGNLRFLEGIPRSRWLSASGGVSVAYVFAHLLPELADGQAAIEGDAGAAIDFLEHHVYLVALIGLAVFYGVEQHSLRSRGARRDGGEDVTSSAAFSLSMASFCLYNAVVGYLLLREELADLESLALYAFALGVHFVVTDFGLRDHHKAQYDRLGRWLLCAAVLLGWLAGVAVTVPDSAIALIVAFIGGGVILNVLKEELPGERQARFLPFASGAVAYTAILQIVQ